MKDYTVVLANSNETYSAFVKANDVKSAIDEAEAEAESNGCDTDLLPVFICEGTVENICP